MPPGPARDDPAHDLPAKAVREGTLHVGDIYFDVQICILKTAFHLKQAISIGVPHIDSLSTADPFLASAPCFGSLLRFLASAPCFGATLAVTLVAFMASVVRNATAFLSRPPSAYKAK